MVFVALFFLFFSRTQAQQSDAYDIDTKGLEPTDIVTRKPYDICGSWGSLGECPHWSEHQEPHYSPPPPLDMFTTLTEVGLSTSTQTEVTPSTVRPDPPTSSSDYCFPEDDGDDCGGPPESWTSARSSKSYVLPTGSTTCIPSSLSTSIIPASTSTNLRPPVESTTHESSTSIPQATTSKSEGHTSSAPHKNSKSSTSSVSSGSSSTPTSTPSDDPITTPQPARKTPPGTIAASIICGVLLLSVALGLFFMIRRYRKREKKAKARMQDERSESNVGPLGPSTNNGGTINNKERTRRDEYYGNDDLFEGALSQGSVDFREWGREGKYE